MGTYPTNPSYLLSNGEHLGEYIKKNPQLLGKSVLDRWGAEIPFLPKVFTYIQVSISIDTDEYRSSPSIKPSLSKSTQI